MKAAWLGLAFASVACAPVYRTELVADVRATATPGPAAISAEVPVDDRGSFRKLTWLLALPRAVALEYEVTCPGAGVVSKGTEGETFERYRERRIAELNRERQANARALGGLVGAIVPKVGASAEASTPTAAASASATVDPGAAATQAALAGLPPVELPPGDVGARSIHRELDVSSAQPGRCVLTFRSQVPGQDLSGVLVQARMVRLVDVDAEQRAQASARAAAEARAGQQLRARLLVSLTTQGADPGKRARDLATAQAAQTQRQAQETQRRRELEQQTAARDVELRLAALRLRARLVASLTAQGANPYWRWTLQVQRAKDAADEQRAAEHRQQAAAERTRAELDAAYSLRRFTVAALVRLGADAEYRAHMAEAARRQREEEQRRREIERAEASVRRQQEAQVQAQRAESQATMAAARIQLELAAALRLRLRLVTTLGTLGADPELRRRVNEQEIREFEAAQRRREQQRQDDEARSRRARADAEELARLQLAAAFQLRLRLLSQLQLMGADPEHQKRENEAEIRAFEDENRRRAQAVREERRRDEHAVSAAFNLRQTLVLHLVALGADPLFRQHNEEARRRWEQQQQQQPVVASPDPVTVAPAPAPVPVPAAAPLPDARTQVTTSVALPPQPAAPAEIRPPAPHPLAIWVGGKFTWNGSVWLWTTGHWELPPAGLDVHIDVGGRRDVHVGTPPVRRPTPPRPRSR